MIGDLEQEFAGRIERQDTGERGIGDVKNSLASSHGDGRSEPNTPELIPALPFHFRAVVEAHAVCAGVGQAEVVVFIEGEAERFGKGFIAFFGAGDPMAKAGEGGLADAEVGWTGEALDVGNAGSVRRGRPD